MPLFSVVIPTYNRAGFLRTTLESVLAQDCKDYEIIVVDDGSEDDTQEVLASFSNSISIHVIRQKNGGPGNARNVGAAAAKGEYLAFLDSDDIWFCWTLSTYAEAIRNYAKPAIVNGRIVEFKNIGEIAGVGRADLHGEYFKDYYGTSRRGYFAGAGKCIIKASVFEKVAGFTNIRINGEDHDLMMRLGTTGGFVQIVQPSMVAWRRHTASETVDLIKTVAGARHILDSEVRKAYPGGQERSWDRRRIIGMHIRPISLELARKGESWKGLKLYLATFRWHILLGRWTYSLGYPVMLVLSLLNPRASRA